MGDQEHSAHQAGKEQGHIKKEHDSFMGTKQKGSGPGVLNEESPFPHPKWNLLSAFCMALGHLPIILSQSLSSPFSQAESRSRLQSCVNLRDYSVQLTCEDTVCMRFLPGTHRTKTTPGVPIKFKCFISEKLCQTLHSLPDQSVLTAVRWFHFTVSHPLLPFPSPLWAIGEHVLP